MYELWVFLHYFGLAIGAGTPIYMMAIARQARKSGDPAVVKTAITTSGKAVTMVGAIGLTLLIISGLVMASNLGPAIAQLGTPFTLKMIGVVLIVIFIGTIKVLIRKASNEDGMQSMGLIRKIAPIGPVLSIGVILLAVLSFN